MGYQKSLRNVFLSFSLELKKTWRALGLKRQSIPQLSTKVIGTLKASLTVGVMTLKLILSNCLVIFLIEQVISL